ncbi:glutathione S-transferase N-terminal domain-containing protein [Mesorhizobium sp. 1B3]|uniref:glutathione S-transferase N-terminal domain-containing protein n=1 Tax=Mesorhizobium sp. 1B3 TaxID=3243599 RepID=UPI003D95EA6C
MPELRLWFSPGACSLAPHILLHEIGAAFEAVKTSIPEGAHLTEEFTRLNPKNRVPVLMLDGEVITELPAIATAISNLAPDKCLMGRTDLDRVRAYEWMNWLSGTVHGQGFGGLWRPQRFSDDPAVFENIRTKARRTIADCFETIDRRLSSTYSTGQNFTAVDAFLLVFYRWGNGIGIDVATAFPRYASFAEPLLQRPSVAAAIAAEGINAHGR